LPKARLLAGLAAVVAGIAYGWGIANNPLHYVNAAVVRSMSESWHNFFYAAFDPAGFLAIDSAPGGYWIQALFARVFGYHAWAMLLPQVLAGAATVLVLFGLVRRWAGNAAGVIAAVVLAATPVTIVATRINLVDAFLVLALVSAAYTFWRALESGTWKWLAATALLAGFGFHVKLFPALVILPVLAVVYLACAPIPTARRLAHIAWAGGLAMAASSIWVVFVALTPASARPYVDGSTSNSVWQMVWNYNTFSRVEGDAAFQPGSFEVPVLRDGQPIPNDQGGDAGLARLFGDQVGGQISWLLPLAAVLLVAGLLATWRASRTDRSRAGWLLWGGWLLVYGLAVSLPPSMHPYYTVLLAPPIAAIVGAGLWSAVTSWTGRAQWWVLPVGLLATGTWTVVLLGRASDYQPWLRPLVVIATVGAVAATLLYRRGERLRVVGPLAAGATAVAVLAAPLAWAGPTFSQPADPRVAFFQSFSPLAGPDPHAQSTGVDASAPPDAGGPGGEGAPPGGGAPGGPGEPGADAQLPPTIVRWTMPTYADPKLMGYLLANYQGERFHLATTGASAATWYIREGMSVMIMGGFGGTTPVPTREELVAAVEAGELRFVLIGGFAFESPTGLERQAWVLDNCARVNPEEYAATPQMMSTSALFDCRPRPGSA
jgi:4-amino-4-deoxy-L-arabinose transferase-like glycosyltransferase